MERWGGGHIDNPVRKGRGGGGSKAISLSLSLFLFFAFFGPSERIYEGRPQAGFAGGGGSGHWIRHRHCTRGEGL